MSSRASTTDSQAQQSTPLKRKREKPIVVPNDGALKEEPYFLDDQAMQRVVDLLTQDKWINDDCINKVLEVFNPDPVAWYVASAHLLLHGEHPETVSPKQRKLLVDPKRKLLFPLHLSNMSHWALAVFDCKRNCCLVFDPMGSKKCNELASKIVHGFLKRHGLWEGEVVMDCDLFPRSVKPTATTAASLCWLWRYTCCTAGKPKPPPRNCGKNSWLHTSSRKASRLVRG
jgi:hypothetical protein